MAEDPPESVRLVPFIEPEDPDFPDSGRFVVGFRDEDGNRWTNIVPLERIAVERAALLSNSFYAHMSSDGTVQPRPEDVEDGLFSEMQEQGLLQRTEIDTLVAHTLELDVNEPNDGDGGVLPDYLVLRHRLNHALGLVDAEIARRKARSPASEDPTGS